MSLPTFPDDALFEAVLNYVAVRAPVFRIKPIGAEGSAAREQQIMEIAAEDRLNAAIATYASALPGQNKAGRI